MERLPSLAAYMKQRGINARMVAELLGLTGSPIREWMVTGKIPIRHMRRLCALTKEETDELDIKNRRLAFWERDGKVLRSLLPCINALETEGRE